ncbi:MAG: hypothetical protein M1840_002320 [Geoglossum simile]|nr:MAG: hypothetical protein M1840_002320 [Geoglossum simile]
MANHIDLSTGGFMLTPPRSPSNIEGNGPSLIQYSKELNTSTDSKERLRRLRHTKKEQDRRKRNKVETDRLRGRVPGCDLQTPKAEVLARANNYLSKLEQQLQEAIRKIRDMEGQPSSAE